jgi:WD40 repeat protein
MNLFLETIVSNIEYQIELRVESLVQELNNQLDKSVTKNREEILEFNNDFSVGYLYFNYYKNIKLMSEISCCDTIFKLVELKNKNILLQSVNGSIYILHFKSSIIELKIKNNMTSSTFYSLLEHSSGKIVVTFGDLIQIWNSSLTECLISYKHSRIILSIQETHNGNIISISIFGTIDIFNNDLTLIEKVFNYSSSLLYKKEFIQVNNEYIVVYSDCDWTQIKVFNIQDETVICLIGHTELVTHIMLSKMGYIVSVSRDETIKLWNVKTSKCVKTFTGNYGSTFSIIETKNNYIVTGSYKKLKMWNMKSDNISCENVIDIHKLDPNMVEQTHYCPIINLLESRYSDIICQTTDAFYIINIEKKLMIFKYIYTNYCKCQIIESEDMKILLCDNDKLKFYY